MKRRGEGQIQRGGGVLPILQPPYVPEALGLPHCISFALEDVRDLYLFFNLVHTAWGGGAINCPLP